MKGHYDDFHWDYYSYERPKKVQNGIKAKSERGTIGETWWSRRWLQALEDLGMGSRLSRGRSYARQGQVLSIDLSEGQVKARVQGSLREPYKVTIRLQTLNKTEWERATTAMASRAIFAAKLLANEMPANIEEAFQEVQLALFPSSDEDLKTSCSCPDWANPCKHIAAVYYILAERFDENPFLLFKLRGRSQEVLLADIREKRLAALPANTTSPASSASIAPLPVLAPVRLEEQLSNFWQTAEPLENFSVSPQTPNVEQAVLKRLGPAPYSIGKQNLSTALVRIYERVEEAALSKAEREEPEMSSS